MSFAAACLAGESAVELASESDPVADGAPAEPPVPADPSASPQPATSADSPVEPGAGPRWGPPDHATLSLERLGSAGLYAYVPHRPQAHQVKGSGHTHCSPDHSDIAASTQEQRLRDLPAPHAHGFVWMTAHGFVAPDPGVPGIRHMFGAEVYTAKQPASGQEPHLLVYLPDGALADAKGRPFGYFDQDVSEVSQLAGEAGGITAWAHPSRQPLTDAELDALDGLWGMEVVSGATDVEANLAFLDKRLSLGHYTCLTGGGDIHDEDYRLTRGYQLVDVASAEPSREELFEEVRSCNFFVCETANPRTAPLDSPALFVSDDSISVSVAAEVETIRFIGAGGRVLSESSGPSSASYAPRAGDGYVRAEISSAGGEARCYSQPVWLVDEEVL